MKPASLSALLFIVSASLAPIAATPPPDDLSPSISAATIFADGEDLVYEVSWTFIKLGTIHIKTLGDFKAIAHIDSYEGLPFVDLHSVHYTEMDSAFYARGGYALDKEGKEWKGLRYIPDPSNNSVAIEELHHKDPASPPYKREIKDTMHLKTSSFVDGLSIGYLPRLFIHSAQTVNALTLLKGTLGTTTYFFSNTHTTESIDALDEPVRVIEVQGSTSAVGVYGMTGEFTGWFSDDDAAVPIKGKVKVLLGNVTVELIQWNRKGWRPPQ